MLIFGVKSLMKKITLIVFCVTAFTSFYAQGIKPGISFTYFSVSNVNDRSLVYRESTINVNVSYNLYSGHNLGIQYMNIFTSGSEFTFTEEKESYYIAGMFYQFDFLPNSTNELYPELSINYGNHCTCSDQDPYKKEGIIYLGHGFGYDWNIAQNLYLDLGLHYYYPLTEKDKEPATYSFVQYIIGLSYRIW